LTLESWQIEAVNTTGEMPAWIYEHRARFDRKRNTICVAGGKLHVVSDDGEPNIIPSNEQFELDLSIFRWRRMQ
jgi:hypothetical protein